MRNEHESGGYAFLPGLGFASAGVVALPGMAIEHATFAKPVPLPDGYEAIARLLAARRRPLEALCGVELRMPAPLSPDSFASFNDRYIEQMDRWRLLRDDRVPFARTNVAPLAGPPAPGVIACSYTVEDPEVEVPSFVISGVAELPAGAKCPEGVIRSGETSDDALREKANWILGDIRTRIAALEVEWQPADVINLYWDNLDLFPIIRSVFDGAGISPNRGVCWYDSRAPMIGLEFEIDVRRYVNMVTVQS